MQDILLVNNLVKQKTTRGEFIITQLDRVAEYKFALFELHTFKCERLAHKLKLIQNAKHYGEKPIPISVGYDAVFGKDNDTIFVTVHDETFMLSVDGRGSANEIDCDMDDFVIRKIWFAHLDCPFIKALEFIIRDRLFDDRSVLLRDLVQELKISMRSIRMQLAEHNTDYQHFIKSVRMMVANEVLANGGTTIDAAKAARYSDASGFSHEFARLYGYPPGKHKKKKPL